MNRGCAVKGGFLIQAVFSLIILFALIMVKPCFSSTYAVEIVNIDVGRNHYGLWWHMNSFALTSGVDTSVELRNNLNVTVALRISCSMSDEAGNIIGSLQKSENLTANANSSITMGLIRFPLWARVGIGMVYVNVVYAGGIPICPDAEETFLIIPPLHSFLSLEASVYSGQTLPNTIFWIDETQAFSSSSSFLIQGEHVIKAIQSFYAVSSDGTLYLFTFKCWGDSSTSVYRPIDLRSNMTQTAYYLKSRIHIQPLGNLI
jgi:hypothetical protein